MPGKAKLIVTTAVVTALLTAVASAQTGGLLGGSGESDITLPGDVGVDLPDENGGGGVTLPGGAGVQLPGGGSGGGDTGGGSDVPLPGGGGVNRPDDDGPAPAPEPAPTAPAPPDDGTADTGTSAPDGTTGPGGGRGDGRDNEPGGQGSLHVDDRDDADDPTGTSTAPPLRHPDGTPTNTNPSLTVAPFGPAPIGVSNFVIDRFTIPPFLLPIYQACGTQYGIPWQVLASINRIETAFGTNLNVSTAGALGWMQFMPATWEMYGVDANADGRKDPYNPVDAICAAARYLKAAGGAEDLRTAIFAYNHADWYVDEVLLYANQYGKLPETLVSSLTGLTEGAHFPVAADARYADDVSERRELERSKQGRDGDAAPPSIGIYADDGAPVIAVNDGVIRDVGRSPQLGRYVVLQDAYGNRFTYANLGRVATAYPAPRQRGPDAGDYRLTAPKYDRGAGQDGPVNTEDSPRRLFALPEPARDELAPEASDGTLDERLFDGFPNFERFRAYTSGILRFNRKTMELRQLQEGSKVVAGTMLGRIGDDGATAPHLEFSIRPGGRGAPAINPKPILDGWKLLEATALYRVVGKDPFAGGGASISQILLLTKEQLARRVLSDPQLEIYECGRQDVQTGQIDRRLLALLEYLVGRGFKLTITSLKCGHSITTASGNISEHSTGSAVDIAAINGVPVIGHQGPGSLADALIRDTLELQGTMEPHQIISLMDYFNADNTFAMGDHDDHVHIGYAPEYGPISSTADDRITALLEPAQWRRLIERIGEIDNPSVPTKPSDAALPAHERDKASPAHQGE